MKALIIVLNELDYLDRILQEFLRLEVKGATILESEGMLKSVLKSEGLSHLFRDMFFTKKPDDVNASKTIFTVIKDDEKVLEVVNAIQTILEESSKQTVGFMFTVPVSNVYPLKK